VSINEYVVKLAEVLAQSEEYKAFVAAKENLKKNKANEEMLDSFRKRQFELQMAELAGYEVNEEERDQLEKEYQLLSLNPEINEYLNAEYRFSLIMSDIQGAITGAVPEWFDFTPTIPGQGAPCLQ
jgi:cell fate (sporulation/competence/biofilm development) regulator YlbF (YheA/YmcA/DUF963 family)